METKRMPNRQELVASIQQTLKWRSNAKNNDEYNLCCSLNLEAANALKAYDYGFYIVDGTSIPIQELILYK